MIKADVQTTEGTPRERTQSQTVCRVNARVFWMLLIGEAVLLIAVLVWVLNYAAQPTTALTTTEDVSLVREAVWARLMGTVNDPLIEVQPGISVRESNVRGFMLNGVVYYYYVEGNQNFDPLSRGAVDQDRVEVLLRDADGPLPVVIYTIH